MNASGPGRGRTSARWLALGACLLAVGAGVAAGWFARPGSPVSAVAYGGSRLPVINAHLREAVAPYGFLAGDSYAEMSPAERLPCGPDMVNGGISGIKTGEYLKLARSLRFEALPKVVLLTIGTNDLLAKHDPAAPAALARFRADAEALIDLLAATGAPVVVAALPPIPERLGTVFQPAAFELYTDAFAEICGRRGCRVVDPYAAVRSDEFWKGRDGSSRDGLHVGDLRAAYRSIADTLCR